MVTLKKKAVLCTDRIVFSPALGAEQSRAEPGTTATYRMAAASKTGPPARWIQSAGTFVNGEGTDKTDADAQLDHGTG